MATITEDYVSYEVAKLLKEKGFDEECWCWYEEDGYFKNSNDDYGFQSNSDHISDDFICSTPTLQMTMKWLLEVHNINIDIVSIWNKVRWEYQIIIITPQTAAKPYIHKTIYIKREQAAEAAIKYCLENLI